MKLFIFVKITEYAYNEVACRVLCTSLGMTSSWNGNRRCLAASAKRGYQSTNFGLQTSPYIIGWCHVIEDLKRIQNVLFTVYTCNSLGYLVQQRSKSAVWPPARAAPRFWRWGYNSRAEKCFNLPPFAYLGGHETEHCTCFIIVIMTFNRLPAPNEIT